MVETQTIKRINLGLIPYGDALKIQTSIHEEVLAGKITDALIFCEHEHVYTFGKSAERNNLLINDDFLNQINAEVFETERGGDVTYHGPGQLVGYPIINLKARKLGVRAYVEVLEQALVEALLDFGLRAFQIEGLTGIWVENGMETRKIGAIGIRVSKGVSMHGFALNVKTALAYFDHINPCGILDKGVTSLKLEGVECTVSQFADAFELKFNSLLNNLSQ